MILRPCCSDVRTTASIPTLRSSPGARSRQCRGVAAGSPDPTAVPNKHLQLRRHRRRLWHGAAQARRSSARRNRPRQWLPRSHTPLGCRSSREAGSVGTVDTSAIIASTAVVDTAAMCAAVLVEGTTDMVAIPEAAVHHIATAATVIAMAVETTGMAAVAAEGATATGTAGAAIATPVAVARGSAGGRVAIVEEVTATAEATAQVAAIATVEAIIATTEGATMDRGDILRMTLRSHRPRTAACLSATGHHHHPHATCRRLRPLATGLRRPLLSKLISTRAKTRHQCHRSCPRTCHRHTETEPLAECHCRPTAMGAWCIRGCHLTRTVGLRPYHTAVAPCRPRRCRTVGGTAALPPTCEAGTATTTCART